MSKETAKWLNSNVLIGFVDKRGHAWHYKASEQGDEPNHYPGAIPVDDVLRRLFPWHAVELPLLVPVPCSLFEATNVDADGHGIKYVVVPNRKAIARDDTYDVLGTGSDGWTGHQYDEWLIDNVASLLSRSRNELGIGSAGLLRNGARAWVQVETPENLTTPEGVRYRPNLLAGTSFDQSLASIYKPTIGMVVCDNTLEAGLGEYGAQVKVYHSKGAKLDLDHAQDALGLLDLAGKAFAAEVSKLCATPVSEAQWQRLLDKIAPIPVDGSSAFAERKRTALNGLWRFDERVAPWTGTAFGVLQATNTWATHMQTVRGSNRVERNMNSVLLGTAAQADSEILKVLATV